MSLGLNSSSKSHQEAPQTPRRSLSKQDFSQNPQSKSGVKIEPGQLPTSNRKAPEQPLFGAPLRAQSRTPNYITMGMIHVNPTATKVSICKGVILFTIKMLSMLTAIFFWLATAIWFKTLLCWKAPGQLLYDLVVRYLSGAPINDAIWRHIFPGTDYGNSHHLRLAIHTSSYTHSPAIYSTSIPLLLDNPVVWLSLMAFMFVGHHLLCFSHDCLSSHHNN